jgi:hypothetical protein
MTTAPLAHTKQPLDEAARGTGQRSRISFRQPLSTAGFIDAAWWPRTRELTTELPALMDVLWTAGREVNRITYHMHAWNPAPRHLQIESRTVRLGGFTVGDPHTVTLSDPWGHERIDILVITPDTDPDVAQRIFDLASLAEDPYRADEILELANSAARYPVTRS